MFWEKRKKKLSFWISNNNEVIIDTNIEKQYEVIHLALAFIVKLSWVFTGSNLFIADQVYRRMRNTNKDTIEWVAFSEIPKNKAFKIVIKSDFISDSLPSIGDLYIMEGAFALLAAIYSKICSENQTSLLKAITVLTPYLQNVDKSIRGLLNIKNAFNQTMNSINWQ